jgi:four helix bundle protein
MSIAEILKKRTSDFALDIIRFCDALPPTLGARRISSQLFDAGTSVGANYRATCRARSKREFIAKIGLVIEEADESEYWLMLLKRAGLAKGVEVDRLFDEAGQLVAVFTRSQKTAISNLEKEKLARKNKRNGSAEC